MDELLGPITSLIEELEKTSSPRAFLEKINGVIVIPGFISTGDGGLLALSPPMQRLITQISGILKQADSTLRRSYTNNEWIKRVGSAFGPPLATIDWAKDPSERAKTVKKEVRKSLNKNTVLGICEHGLGCTLFHDETIAPFSIGPVRIENRLDWLARKEGKKDVTPVLARRVRKVWSGKKIRKRKNRIDEARKLKSRTAVRDEILEPAVIHAIGNCAYVCSVTTNGLANEARELKSRTAARLALTGIAALFEVPSRMLDGSNLLVDRSARRTTLLEFGPGHAIRAGRERQGMPHGVRNTPAEWAINLVEEKNYFDAVGELIDYYLSPTGNLNRPNLMNTLEQALLSFHEGCRAQVDLMAIVYFAATLDVLASGGGTEGILKLIEARTERKREDRPLKNSSKDWTIRQCVKQIYSEGRSRAIHGTLKNPGDDWTFIRELSEILARECLIKCLDWAGENKKKDDPKRLLKK